MKKKCRLSADIVLSIIFIFCIVELGGYTAFKAGFFYRFICPCYINQYAFLFDIINNLSMTYMMSYFFYILVLIPERRKQKSINKYVKIYLGNILRLLEQIVQISESFKSGQRSLSDSPKLSGAERGQSGKYEFLTYREHFLRFYKEFYREYEHLSHYIAFVENDLRDCLYQIVTDDFIVRIKDLLVDADDNRFDALFEQTMDDSSIMALCTQLEQIYARR